MLTFTIIGVAVGIILAVASSPPRPPPKHDSPEETYVDFNRKLREMAERNRRAQNDTRARNGR